jgi:hypothetical protein
LIPIKLSIMLKKEFQIHLRKIIKEIKIIIFGNQNYLIRRN